MKILHLVQNYYPSIGGIQELLRCYSECLVQNYGDQVTIFTTNALQSPHDSKINYISNKNDVIHGVHIRRFSFIRQITTSIRFVNSVSKMTKIPYPFEKFFRFIQSGPISPAMLIATLKADVDIIAAASAPFVHTTYPLIANRLGRKTPFFYIGALHLHEQNLPDIVLRSIQSSHGYIALTEFEKDYLIDRGISKDSVHVIGPGILHEKYSHANDKVVRCKHGLGNAPVVGYIGRLAAYKGIDTLLQAMKQVWKFIPQVHLLIAGSQTNYSPKLKLIIESLDESQQDRITLVEDLSEEEKSNYYAAVDLVVTVSQAESFGIVYLEAWAAGKPVIGGDIGSVRSVIDNNKNGLLVACGNVNALTDAIIDLLLDETKRKQFGENGYNKVTRNYTWDHVGAKLHSLYQSVVA